MKKLSIIVPIYNTRNELTRCLQSIQNQIYTNLEIICVDDGSNDGSEEIVDEFASRDNRFIVVHQRNRGESNARNVGLSMATGDYITFCDCDDWIDVDMYSTMMKELMLYDLDMVCASWYKEFEDRSIEIKNEKSVEKTTFGQQQFLNYLFKRDNYRSFAYMWNKIYSRDVLKEKDGQLIKFDESLRLGGDVLYLATVAMNVKKVKFIDRCFYHYYQRSESGCHTKDLEKMSDWLRAYEMVISLYGLNNVDMEVVDYVKRFIAYHGSNAAEMAIEQKNKNKLVEFIAIMRKYEKEYLRLNNQYPMRIRRYQRILKEGKNEEI